MSVNNSQLKKRKLIYKFTFMKWTPERRLSTFERTAIETSLAIHNFGNGATETTFRKLSESVADIKTMIEVAELTFPILKAEAERIMKEKLVALDIRTQEEDILQKAFILEVIFFESFLLKGRLKRFKRPSCFPSQ